MKLSALSDCTNMNMAIRAQALGPLLLLAAMLLLPQSVLAQNCSAANITLTSQAQVDSFQTDFGGGGTCDTVTNSLTIEDAGSTITNLDGLAALTSVGNNLVIRENAALTNLNGLAALTSVGDQFFIFSNPVLANINGLSALSSVGGFFTIRENSALTNLDGLGALTSTSSSLTIDDNAALTNLDGLAPLTSVGTALVITDNTTLTNLDGLAALTSVGTGLTVEDNPALTNVDGLSALASVGTGLRIFRNDALTNLNGLAAVPSVGTELVVSTNASLTNVDGLAAISSVGGVLTIGFNPALTNLDGLAAITSVGGNLNVVSNPTLTSCSGLSAVLGGPPGPWSPATDFVVGIVTINATNGVGAQSPDDCLTPVTPPSSCSAANITLTSQAQVDSFQADFGGGGTCDTVTGDLIIQDAGSTITNLDGLAALTSVGGGLTIRENPALTNVDGLAALTSVVGEFFILTNAALTNLNGLAALAGVGQWLAILDHPALTNIDGLAALTSVGDFLDIRDNTALANVDGLAALTSMAGFLRILNNTALTNLDGLAALASVGGEMIVQNNDALTSCTGLATVLGGPPGPHDPATDFVGGTVTIDGTNGVGAQSPDDCLTVAAVPNTVGGSVSGLTGAGLVLRNNGSDDLAITTNGPFTFSTGLLAGEAYLVTVGSQPAGQTCTLSNAGGIMPATAVTNVQVTCSDDQLPPVTPPGDPAVAVPVLPLWAMALLVALLGGMGMRRLRVATTAT